jgi:hypothetical protein
MGHPVPVEGRWDRPVAAELAVNASERDGVWDRGGSALAFRPCLSGHERGISDLLGEMGKTPSLLARPKPRRRDHAAFLRRQPVSDVSAKT